MFFRADPTPFDLHFSLFGIRVRIHPYFWLTSALITWMPGDFPGMILQIGCVFITVLVHEMGHALTARASGWPSEIVLAAFGGYAAHIPLGRISTGRRIGIIFAGPGAGFVLYLITEGILKLGFQKGFFSPERFESPLFLRMYLILTSLNWFNFWWSTFNLLPVFPLDGGQIVREALSSWRGYRGTVLAAQISLVGAVALSAYFFFVCKPPHVFSGILFASLAYDAYQNYQMRRF